MKIEKEHIGQIIYGLRYGVNVRGKESLESYKVLAVKRRYAELIRLDSNGTPCNYSKGLYDRVTGETDSDARSGYVSSYIHWFEDSREYNTWQIIQSKRKRLSKFFGYNWSNNNMSDSDITELYQLLRQQGHLENEVSTDNNNL